MQSNDLYQRSQRAAHHRPIGLTARRVAAVASEFLKLSLIVAVFAVVGICLAA